MTELMLALKTHGKKHGKSIWVVKVIQANSHRRGREGKAKRKAN